MAENRKNEPIKQFFARNVSGSVFQSEGMKDGRSFKTFSVSFSRSYKDKDGKWAYSSSFRAQDLPKLTVVTRQLYDWFVSQEFAEISK